MIKQWMEWGSLFSDKPKPVHNSQLDEIDPFNVVMNKVEMVFFHQCKWFVHGLYKKWIIKNDNLCRCPHQFLVLFITKRMAVGDIPHCSKFQTLTLEI
jgi:hypothetical protein